MKLCSKSRDLPKHVSLRHRKAAASFEQRADITNSLHTELSRSPEWNIVRGYYERTVLRYTGLYLVRTCLGDSGLVYCYFRVKNSSYWDT